MKKPIKFLRDAIVFTLLTVILTGCGKEIPPMIEENATQPVTQITTETDSNQITNAIKKDDTEITNPITNNTSDNSTSSDAIPENNYSDSNNLIIKETNQNTNPEINNPVIQEPDSITPDDKPGIDEIINNLPNNPNENNNDIDEIEEPVIEDPILEDSPIIENPIINNPIIDDPIEEDPIEDPIIDEPVGNEPTTEIENPIENNPEEDPIIEEPIPVTKVIDSFKFHDYTESAYLDNYDFIKSDLKYPSSQDKIDKVKEQFAKFPLYIQEYLRDNGWIIYVRDSLYYKDKGYNNTLYGLCIYGPKEIYVYAWHTHTIYHEVYHALNFYLYNANNSSIINSIHREEWEKLYNCYNTAKTNVQTTSEYFCTAMEVYFYNNELLKENCPRTYNFIRCILEGVFYIDEDTAGKSLLQNNKWFDTVIFDEDTNLTKLEKFAFPNCPNITKVYYKGKLYMDWDTLVLAMKKDGVDVTKKSFIETGMPK